MKNSEILLDVIGETADELIPDPDSIRKTKKPVSRKIITGGICAAAAVLACVMLLPHFGKGPASTQEPGNPSAQNPQENSAQQTGSPAVLLAHAAYPDIPAYPTEEGVTDWEQHSRDFEAWNKACRKLRNQPAGYQEGFSEFFTKTAPVFLETEPEKNRVYSPLSLFLALGMSAETADGSTRQQILDVLSQPDIKTLRSHANSIWQANYMDDGMAKCVLANSLWTNSAFPYTEKTVSSLAEQYYASVYAGDPASEAYNSMMREWVSEQTDGLLDEDISELNMDPETVLMLISTVNYSGKWNWHFNREETAPDTFHAPAGDLTCDFMHKTDETTYIWGEHFAAVSLALENNGSMRLILPDEGFTPEQLLSDTALMTYLSSADTPASNKFVTVHLSVPKFDVSSSADLTDGLKALGVTEMFDAETADFSPLSPSAAGLAVSKVQQNTRVQIDEEGCRAAAMTAMIYAGSAMPQDETDFTLDRPFLFEIMSETGLPLFVGIVNIPEPK